MGLDDFVDDEENQDSDLYSDPPKDYDSWVEAEPDPDQDWHWKVTGNKCNIDNEVFDPDETVFIAKDVDDRESFVASNHFMKLTEIA